MAFSLLGPQTRVLYILQIRASGPGVSKGPRAYICTALISARDAFPRQAEEKGTICPPRNCLSPLPVEEKAISGLSKMLAIAFPLCLSRERQFQGVARKPKSVPFRMILGTSSGFSRSPFPFACRRKGCFRVPRACSQWPFPPACRGKGNFRAPPGTPQSGWGALETQ